MGRKWGGRARARARARSKISNSKTDRESAERERAARDRLREKLLADLSPVLGTAPLPRGGLPKGGSPRRFGCPGEMNCLGLATRLNWRGLDCSECPVPVGGPAFAVNAEIAWSRRPNELPRDDPSDVARANRSKEEPMGKSVYELLPRKARNAIRAAIEDPEVRIADLRRDLLDLGVTDAEIGTSSNLRQYVGRRRAKIDGGRDRSAPRSAPLARRPPPPSPEPEVLPGKIPPDAVGKKVAALERRTVERVEFAETGLITVYPDGRITTTDVEQAVRISRLMRSDDRCPTS